MATDGPFVCEMVSMRAELCWLCQCFMMWQVFVKWYRDVIFRVRGLSSRTIWKCPYLRHLAKSKFHHSKACGMRELYSAWAGRVGGTSCIPSDKVQQLFNDMHLYPSKSEVLEMLQCAQKCAQRSSPGYLTFGEFCVFATELKRSYEKGIRPVQYSRLLDRDGEEKKRRERERARKKGKYEVFLGGSCNPTTWRQDVAIPLLKSRGVTFYNPQVSNWRPELIEIEHHAKESAAVLFFVIDNQTRNTATSVEVAYYAGLRRNIILVIQPYQSSGCKIGGEPVADDELADLIATQQVMKSLIERQGMPVFHSIPDALNCTAKVLRDNISIQELGIKEIVPPVKMGHIQLGDKLIKLREAFDALDTSGTGQITLRDVCIAFRVLTNKSLSDADLRNVVSGQAGDLEREAKENVSFEDLRVNFDQFCAVVAEFKSSQEKWSTLPLRASGIPASRRSNCSRDVYLGGSGVNTTWREDVAIPILKKNGLTYFNPVNNHWVRRLALQAANAMDNSHILLFVVTDTARSLPEMSMASHYIGLGWNVVLCVQLFTEDSTVCGSKLSKDALKDYNRGRMYLRDLAARESVPVFDTVAAAVECVVSKCTTCY